MFKKYMLYLLRWQLSTPILAIVLKLLANMNTLYATIIANLIGGLIFFWVDKFIFKRKSDIPLWEIKKDVICHDCHKKTKGYRIVSWGNYDKLDDPHPKYRCKECSLKKMKIISRTKKSNYRLFLCMFSTCYEVI